MVTIALVAALALLTFVARLLERGALIVHADTPHPDLLRVAFRMRATKHLFALFTLAVIAIGTVQASAA